MNKSMTWIGSLFFALTTLGCNELLGTEAGDLDPLKIEAPDPHETLAGPQVTLRWSGGLAPYFVEISAESSFTPEQGERPVDLTLETSEQSATVDLPGGRFSWRVRCASCGPDGASAWHRLHITGTPILLARSGAIGRSSATIAWNAVDREYGIVFGDGTPRKLMFTRVDALGNILLEPTHIADKVQFHATPKTEAGAYTSSVAYVASRDQWAIAYRMEGPGASDQSYLFAVDDHGQIVRESIALDDGYDCESTAITYDERTGTIVVATDHVAAPVAGGTQPVWSPRVYRFDADLKPIGAPANVSWGQAILGSMVSLPGLDAPGNQALVSFTYMDIDEARTDHVAIQLVDLETSELRWPWGSSTPEMAGKVVLPDVGLFTRSRTAWIPEAQRIALAYTENSTTVDGQIHTSDAYIALLDPLTGSVTSTPLHLNAATPQTVIDWSSPHITWDGEELLVMWLELTSSGARQTRMLKLDSAGHQIGAGVRLLREGADEITVSVHGPAVAAHDGIHAVVYGESFHAELAGGLWLYIEPPYQGRPPPRCPAFQ